MSFDSYIKRLGRLMYKVIYKSTSHLSAAITKMRDLVGSEDINLHGENRECMLQTVLGYDNLPR